MINLADTEAEGLKVLEAQLARDLLNLELPAKPWVPARYVGAKTVRDVVVIGAGMCGLAALAKLELSGITNAVAYDAAAEGQEGPWITFARMETLRSPKTLAGPSLGLAQLTFRAWFTAQFGDAAWEALDKIPKAQWMDYLVWYRHVLALPVVNGTRMTGIREQGDLIAIDLEGAETGRVLTRHLVLATGRSGLGGFSVPPFLSGIDRRFWAHSADAVDSEALAGKRVAVIGAGASAVDNAAAVLEAGAGQVDLLIRRKEMPRINDMLRALRRRRHEFVAGAEACRAAVLHPASEHGLGRDLRAALACRMARLNKDNELTSEYQALLHGLARSKELLLVAEGRHEVDEPLTTITRHVDLVTIDPKGAQASDIRRLEAAGLTKPQIVALFELIAFVNFQTRVVAGLRLLRSE